MTRTRGLPGSDPGARASTRCAGCAPAATRSNVGIYGSGQAYEALLLRLRAHPLAEASATGELMLPELRKVIAAFLARVDRPDRGVRWAEYLAGRRADTAQARQRSRQPGVDAESRPEVTLTDFDPDGEIKVVAAALYSASRLPHDQLIAVARAMPLDDRMRVLRAYVGQRENRRHKPGRAFERATYSFDVLSDYGAFRDLQRHRMLTIDWQHLTPGAGCTRPAAIDDVGAGEDWRRVTEESADLHRRLAAAHSVPVAQYSVSMAYRIRFYLQMNAREAMHVIELRTAPQGHPAYRRVCQEIHRLVAEEAAHRAIADTMIFTDRSAVELGRLPGERASERRRHERVQRPAS